VTTREQFIVELCIAILFGVLLLIGLTVCIIRILRSDRLPAESQPILDAIEGVRQQQSAEHSAMQAEQRSQGGLLRQILDRFGFLRKVK